MAADFWGDAYWAGAYWYSGFWGVTDAGPVGDYWANRYWNSRQWTGHYWQGPQPTSTAYILAADAGSYTLAGQAATLRIAHQLTAAVGTYTLTGIAAALRVAHKLAAATGAYTLTGIAAGLKATHQLTAAKGTFLLTGLVALLSTSRQAASGAYTLTGIAATLRMTRTLPLGKGTFAFSGQDAGFSITLPRTLAAAPGIYSFTGVSANLLLSGAPPVVAVPVSTTDAGSGRKRKEKKSIPIRVFLPGGRVAIAHDQAQFRAIIAAAFARHASPRGGAARGRPVPAAPGSAPAALPQEPIVDLSDLESWRVHDHAATLSLFEAALARAEELQAIEALAAELAAEDEDAIAALIMLAAA